jgi:cell division protease FtsH
LRRKATHRAIAGARSLLTAPERLSLSGRRIVMNETKKTTWIPYLGWCLAVVALLTSLYGWSLESSQLRTIPWTDLVTLAEGNHVSRIVVEKDRIVARLKEPLALTHGATRVSAVRLPGVDDASLIERLRSQGVVIDGRAPDSPWVSSGLVLWIVPLGLLVLLSLWTPRPAGRSPVDASSLAKSKARQYAAGVGNTTRFADVAGVDEAKRELMEVVDFLRHPEKYAVVGGHVPKGILLVGDPGTGKTLLARAVAGEADVPFLSISGSEFVEIFVGVGAARVRDLFEQCKKSAPCIVFIDELDAIGRARGGAQAVATHEEREQTLNQLLVEMDGFDAKSGIVVLAASNRPEILDSALLRPGRFDRRVVVERPDLEGRLAILRVHARHVATDPGIDLKVVAQRTVGMVGADLANLVNESALAAARRGVRSVAQCDLDEAIDRAQLGLRKTARVMSLEEKRRIAYHEAGHALVAMAVSHADPVERVTIIPRSAGALGATLQVATRDRYLLTRSQLTDQLCVCLGGRVAEELALDDVSTGAENDLERATQTAQAMVRSFGMSDRLGPLTYTRSGVAQALSAFAAAAGGAAFSEHTGQLIDAEVRALVESQHRRAREILSAHRSELDRVARELVESESISGARLRALLAPAQDDDSSPREAPRVLAAPALAS